MTALGIETHAVLVISTSMIFFLPIAYLSKSCSSFKMDLCYDLFLNYANSHLSPPPLKFWKSYKPLPPKQFLVRTALLQRQ